MAATVPPSSCSAPALRTVLVTGASGFLAGFIISALRAAGWRVLRAERRPRAGDDDAIACDLARFVDAEAWRPLLRDVDAVVNVAGILRETRRQRFCVIHHEAPLALAHACVEAGVRHFVQISALGRDEDGEFIASKHRFDAALLALPLRAVVLRPSVVYSAAGSYGGTSMLRAMAALPGCLVLPGHGEWRIQPLAAEDLAALVVRALAGEARGCFEVGGPAVVTLRDYLTRWRAWLRLPPAWVLRVPESWVSVAVRMSEVIGSGPMGSAVWSMLRRGNITHPEAQGALHAAFGTAPRALDAVLAAHPSQVQDRWHARLSLLRPVLTAGLLMLFLISAWVGFVTPAASIEALVANSPLAGAHPVTLARAAAGADLVLALALLLGRGLRPVLAGMFALVAGYTAAFGALLPALWLDPLGGLAKNLVVLPAIAVLWVLAERR